MVRRPHSPPPTDAVLGAEHGDGTARDAVMRLLEELPYADDERHPTRVVRAAFLARSRFVRRPDFDILAVPDLGLLFDLYDRHAFRGLLSRILPAGSPGRPDLRVSSRMTRTAGKTVHRRPPISRGASHGASSLEIAISAPLLGAPIEPRRGVPVVGLRCHDRLDVLQRVFEHELVHALMFCLGCDARCSRESFRGTAFGLFGHLESTHGIQLDPTPGRGQARGPTVAARPGDRVRFEFKGTRYEGVVNRVTKRATVLVETAQIKSGGAASAPGKLYSDGVRYTKFYVPLAMLRPVRHPAGDN